MAELLRYLAPWELVAGLGLFLFGMLQTEQALSALGGRRLRRLLRRQTSHPLRAIGVGTIATAVMQSSSFVGLMTLAFVGAELITMANALGVIIGANLGTTATGWLVTWLGFKLSVESLTLPLIAVGSLLMAIQSQHPRWSHWGRLCAGIGLLFFGLGMMKGAFSVPPDTLLDQVVAETHPFKFLLIGFGLTAVIQSSSAMMMIALSALHADLIDLSSAAAVVIGADLGTTITVLLGAIKGSLEKRRVALAHFLFNLVTDGLAFLLLLPWLLPALALVGLNDPLYGLVAFHSVFNLLGIALAYPLLRPFARLLMHLLPDRQDRQSRHISTASLDVPEAALSALAAEVDELLAEGVSLTQRAIGLGPALPSDIMQAYEWIKHHESEIATYALALQERALSEQESYTLQSLLSAARNIVHACKCVKDINHNLQQLADSDEAHERELLQAFQTNQADLHQRIAALCRSQDTALRFSTLVGLIQTNQQSHNRLHELIIAAVRANPELELSSLLNVNRELFVANYVLANSLGDRYLNREQADDLSNLPLLI